MAIAAAVVVTEVVSSGGGSGGGGSGGGGGGGCAVLQPLPHPPTLYTPTLLRPVLLRVSTTCGPLGPTQAGKAALLKGAQSGGFDCGFCATRIHYAACSLAFLDH